MRQFFLDMLPAGLFEKEKRNGILTLLFIALIMLVIEYYGWQGPFGRYWKLIPIVNDDPKNFRLYAQLYTAASFFLFLFLLPLLFALLFPLGEKEDRFHGLGGFDLRFALTRYLPLVLVMWPVVFVATSSPGFYKFYPLYRPTSLSMLLFYEAFYLSMFVGTEYFFRGFGLFRMERLMPGYGVAIMTVPYALIHIHKPFPEALGSIVAGVVLGSLALRTGSIWPGVFTHAAIALSADFFALYHSGRLGKLLGM